MTQYQEKALAKLAEGRKGKMSRREAEVMKVPVANQMEDFCRQDAEFAQAIVQGGSFADCMAAVAGKVHGGSLSDIEAYRAAAAFYFPGCKIHMTMRIDLIGDVASEEGTHKGGIVLNLEDFL